MKITKYDAMGWGLYTVVSLVARAAGLGWGDWEYWAILGLAVTGNVLGWVDGRRGY